MSRRRAPKPDPALTVACPLCNAPRGEPCRSFRAVAIHRARRRALQQLSEQANEIIRRGGAQ